LERRLAAILAADVVGYTRLMARDDAGTFHRLSVLREQVLQPLIDRHHGRVVKLMGDGFLVEFASVVDAVTCAIAWQRDVTAHESGVEDGAKFSFRIGVNLGDVIVEGSDIHGDGVNIASRLEQICPPGTVLLSGEAHDQLPGQIGEMVAYVGQRSLKNVRKPIRIFSAGNTGTSLLLPKTQWRRWMLPVGTVAILTAALIGIAAWTGLAPSFLGLTDRAPEASPSVAVLPFTNASNDPAQNYFSDGITDEILIALARSPILKVVGRNSSSAYRGKIIDAEEVGHRLNARYIVTGSVAKADNRVRVTARLTDVRTGVDLWAEKYDRPLSGVFAVQDEIAGVIAARLGARVESVEASSIEGKDAREFDAYEKVLQARTLRYADASREATMRARLLLLEAIDLDPKSALAHAELGYTYYREIARRWDAARKNEALDKGEAAAARALELDPTLSFASVTMGNLLGRRRDYASAENFMRRAIALNPNDPEGYAGLANILLFANRAEEALPMIERARALDPLHPPLYDTYLGKALLMVGQFKRAIPVLKDCIRRLPDSWPCHGYLAAAFHNVGDEEAARRYFRLMRDLAPFRTIEEYDNMTENLPGPQIDILMNALRDLEQSTGQ
jgi:adenylate cyclase